MQKTSCLKIESYTHPEVDWGTGGGGLQGPPPPQMIHFSHSMYLDMENLMHWFTC